MRTIRGNLWGEHLQKMLAASPSDMAPWMQQHGHILKSDANSLVGLVPVEHEDCYLKLYRYKSIVQKILFQLGRGRPVRSFELARELRARGVVVPEPLACLLVADGMLLLCEGISKGRNLQDLLRQQPDQEKARQLLHGAGDSIARLHRAGYAHGDCKWSNLLWSGQQIYLVDLDGACKAPAGGARQARDIARFTLNAEESGIGPQLYQLFLERYLEGTGGSQNDLVRRMMPSLQKLRSRHLVRYGERGQRLL